MIVTLRPVSVNANSTKGPSRFVQFACITNIEPEIDTDHVGNIINYVLLCVFVESHRLTVNGYRRKASY